MKVILTSDVDRLGESGSVVKVKPGFARNYLLPQGLAVVASKHALLQVEEQQRRKSRQQMLAKEQAETLAAQLRESSCTVTVEADENDRLYGSVNAAQIAEALNQGQWQVDRHQVILDELIRELGVYQVPIQLHPEVMVQVKVWVIRSSDESTE